MSVTPGSSAASACVARVCTQRLSAGCGSNKEKLRIPVVFFFESDSRLALRTLDSDDVVSASSTEEVSALPEANTSAEAERAVREDD